MRAVLVDVGTVGARWMGAALAHPPAEWKWDEVAWPADWPPGLKLQALGESLRRVFPDLSRRLVCFGLPASWAQGRTCLVRYARLHSHIPLSQQELQEILASTQPRAAQRGRREVEQLHAWPRERQYLIHSVILRLRIDGREVEGSPLGERGRMVAFTVYDAYAAPLVARPLRRLIEKQGILRSILIPHAFALARLAFARTDFPAAVVDVGGREIVLTRLLRQPAFESVTIALGAEAWRRVWERALGKDLEKRKINLPAELPRLSEESRRALARLSRREGRLLREGLREAWRQLFLARPPRAAWWCGRGGEVVEIERHLAALLPPGAACRPLHRGLGLPSPQAVVFRALWKVAFEMARWRAWRRAAYRMVRE